MLERIFLSGAVVNCVLVIIGAAVGVLLRKGIPERVKDTLVKGMALCVLYIGVSGIIDSAIKPLVVIVSIALGAVIGELLDLDRMINRLGEKIEKRFNKGEKKVQITEGFVSATLLFCVGAMTVVGSIDSGISNDNTTLYSKSLIDAISAIPMASALGIGVMLSSIPILIIEGALTLLAVVVKPILTADNIVQMSAVGSLLIIAISLNMMGLTKIKVMNLLPAVFLPLALCLFM